MANRSINPKYHVGLGAVTALEQSERGLLLRVGEEKFRVDVIRADVLRLKISRSGKFDESPTFAAAFSMPAPVPFRVNEDAEVITLETSRLKLVIWRAAFGLAAYRADGSAVFEDAAGPDGRSHGYVTPERLVRAHPADCAARRDLRLGREDRPLQPARAELHPVEHGRAAPGRARAKSPA